MNAVKIGWNLCYLGLKRYGYHQSNLIRSIRDCLVIIRKHGWCIGVTPPIPANVTWVPFLNLSLYVSVVACWFPLVLQGVFLGLASTFTKTNIFPFRCQCISTFCRNATAISHFIVLIYSLCSMFNFFRTPKLLYHQL